MPGTTIVRTPVRFERLEQPRAHEYVAEQIRRQIALGMIRPGEALLPERELATMFGVARRTIHLAIGLLAAEGLVARRRGRYGGTFVLDRQPASRTADRALARIRGRGDSLREALDYRLDLEPAAAARAALAHTTDDLARIVDDAQAVAAAKSDAGFIEQDSRFHLAIAHATHNRFLIEGVERVRDVLGDLLAVLPESQMWRDRTTQEHAAVMEALRAGDAEAARRAMAAHIAHTDRSARILLDGL